MHPRGPSPLPNRQVPRPFVQTTSYLSRRTDRPNLRQPRPTAPPGFKTTSRPIDLPSASKGKPNGQKIEKDKPRWDPIPITYTELFPNLVKMGHIEPVQLAPLRPLFPRWYNAHTQCDYHSGNQGHPTKNCTALKYKVRDLINDGKLKFKDLDGPAQVEDPSRAKVEMTRQKHGILRETSLGKAAMSNEEVPIVEVRKSEEGSSTTTEGSTERPCELDKEEEEKKALRELAQGLERMFIKQNECVPTPKEQHNLRALKRRRTLGSNET